MDDNSHVLTFCLMWVLRYSAAFPQSCCRVIRVQTLSHVTCSGCRLQVVQTLPLDTAFLNFRDNKLYSLHRNSFPELPQLKTLNLQFNHLAYISSGAFDNIPNIEDLDLSNNNLDHYSFDLDIFEPLRNLKTLRLHKNKFYLQKVYPEKVLSTTTNLHSLSLDVFDGLLFNDGFLNTTQIQILELFSSKRAPVSFFDHSCNGLRSLNITELSIVGSFRNIERNFLSPFRVLRTLQLKTYSFYMDIHDVLSGLYGLRGKVLDSLTITKFRRKLSQGLKIDKTDTGYLNLICVKKLSLVDNDIGDISTEALVSWSNRTCIEYLDVSRNRLSSSGFPISLVLFSSLTHVDCGYTPSETFVGRRMERNIFLPGAKRTFFLPRNLVYMNMTHHQITGPLINIEVGEDNSLEVLDVSYSGRYPTCSHGVVKGLSHLKELDMSSIDCSDPNPEMFAEFRNLSRLTARQCKLGKVFSSNANSTLFKGLYNLSFVDISLNNIDSLNPNVFSDQRESLRSLGLAGNQMYHVGSLNLSTYIRLEVLDLSHNQISALTESEYLTLDKLKSKSEKFLISLFGNPLVCSCEHLDFISWIKTTEVIYQKHALTCSIPTGGQVKIGEFLKSFDEFEGRCVSQTWLAISITLIFVFFVFGILSREAWKRSVYLRVMCRQPLHNTDYTYDIYICYCDEDSSWVAKTFIPWLDEQELEYSFEDKSFDPGRGIADNIMDALDCSRQTVFVVSCAFLEREWTKFTLNLTSFYSFRQGREDMNIIILMNDIERSEFPRPVRKNWEIIRRLRWPNESNTNQEEHYAAKRKFWKRLLKIIKRRNSQSPVPSLSESSL
ncbi:toll-like receptor 4 [Argopecten irradians]|uniref:toll-like receptor 4 n=1 Tax=Argopecten irradians TaxID=31199 RepID=UPI00371185D2